MRPAQDWDTPMTAILIGLALIIVGAGIATISGALAYLVACGHLHSLSNILDLAFWLQAMCLGGTIGLIGIVQFF
jgi:hypothetical protein